MINEIESMLEKEEIRADNTHTIIIIMRAIEADSKVMEHLGNILERQQYLVEALRELVNIHNSYN